MDSPRNKKILSGIQPSGTVHLGNYLGAIKQWVALQDQNEVYYAIVDQHAIIGDYEPAKMQPAIFDLVAVLLAVGLDPKRATIFVQSHVPAHTELGWLLSTITPLGELARMTQFKDKKKSQHSTGTLGLFAYPVLQAADIFLYQADLVPIGEDQVQHLELARDLARRFNKRFGETFVTPQAYLPKHAARIMSLTDPTSKMSKSAGEKSYIALTDEPDVIRKKIMGAMTETETVFKFTESGLPARASAQAGPAVQNLLHIFEALSGETRAAIEQRFKDSDYKSFKNSLAELVIAQLDPIKKSFTGLRADENKLRSILADGAAVANKTASQTLQLAKKNMGLL